MRYDIVHETKKRMRVKIQGELSLSVGKADMLYHWIADVHGVINVNIHQLTGSVAIEYECDRQKVIDALDQFQFDFEKFHHDCDAKVFIDDEELHRRRFDPHMKRKMRRKILVEMATDTFLPLPIQLGYHVYQLITLKNL